MVEDALNVLFKIPLILQFYFSICSYICPYDLKYFSYIIRYFCPPPRKLVQNSSRICWTLSYSVAALLCFTSGGYSQRLEFHDETPLGPELHAQFPCYGCATTAISPLGLQNKKI